MSSQPPTTWRSIFCSSIHFSRACRSLSGFETGRVGLPPAKEKPRPPPSSIRRIEGKLAAWERIASSRLGGTRWAWQSMIISFARMSFGLLLGFALLRIRNGIADRGNPDWKLVEGDTERRDAIVDRGRNRGWRAEIAAFAGPLLAEHGMRRRRAMMHDLDVRYLVRGRQQVVHETLGDQMAFVVIDELLQQRRAETVRDAAERHALDDVRIDHRAAIMPDHIALDLGLAEHGIDRHQDHVKFEGMARIHLH